jgi:hypothetical protein
VVTKTECGSLDGTFETPFGWKTYAIYVNTARTSEEGAHSPSWQHELIIIICNISITSIISIIIIIKRWTYATLPHAHQSPHTLMPDLTKPLKAGWKPPSPYLSK